MDMGELRAMGPSGDLKLTWDNDNSASIQSAEKAFQDLVDKGYKAFGVTRAVVEKKGRAIKTFNSDLAEIVMVPPMQGG